ncbi:MAG: IS91 family transposase [Acidimicrobiia bacterium]|nr:IS91 family transposase [Acidimicrobiia bacterium]
MVLLNPRRPRLEVADILRAHGDSYCRRHPVSPEQATVMRHLVQCRTAALGGHVDACDNCGHVAISFNSCRNRHCPKCQSTQRAQWIENRLKRVLPVEHFHVVFTLPDKLNPLMLRNKRATYALLFKAAAETLLQLAADPKRLGAQIGFTAVLHTWGQNLLFHPHLHCVVTGGGLAPDGERWIPARPGYLLPIRALSRLFRGKFLAGLQQLHDAGKLDFRGSTEELGDLRAFAQLRRQLYEKEWVVYAKRPFGGADQVFRYLGRYTHRVAIANSRLVSMDDGHVRFRYKNYATDAHKVMTLDAEEFIRRFLLHVLPKRFVRIRHFGILAGRNVLTKLERARHLIGPVRCASDIDHDDAIDRCAITSDESPGRCPHCQRPLMRWTLTTHFDRQMQRPLVTAAVPYLDSS